MGLSRRLKAKDKKADEGTEVKEVICICGERVVFLDPEVRAKTCPNCGITVYQEAGEVRASELMLRKRKFAISRENVILALSVITVLALAAAITAVVTARQKALGRATQLVKQADIAAAGRDYDGAIEGYRQAMDIYVVWFAGDATTEAIASALERARQKRRAAGQTDSGEEDKGLVAVSLEDLAQQAYSDTVEGWEKAFARDYAGSTVVIRGKVEERSGEAYKASALTFSYRVFTPAGEEMRIVFDPPFFERYRLGAGRECVVKVHLSETLLDKGAPGGKGCWVLVVDGSKSGLVTDTAYLRGLGWKVDDEVGDILASQASLSPAF